MIEINERISVLQSSEEPVLSADVYVIKGDRFSYIVDVGSNDEALTLVKSIPNKKIVITHFHDDHTDNLGRLEIPDEDMLNNYTEMLSALKTDIWVDLPGEQKGTESYLTGGGSLIRYGCPTDSSEISVCPVIRVHLDDLT